MCVCVCVCDSARQGGRPSKRVRFSVNNDGWTDSYLELGVVCVV